jgi:acetyltransferase-like isoleucine patch superfamily enzyme
MKKIFQLLRHSMVFINTNYFLLLSRLVGFEQVTFKLSLIPYRIGNDIRYSFYRKTLTSVGEKVIFSFGTVVTNKDTIIGSNVRFGPYNTIGWAKIGNDVLTAQYVHILSGSKQHSFSRMDVPITSQPGIIRCVSLGGDNWIGANVVIMDNINKGSIVGSGSVVNSEIPQYSISAGNPCKVIRTRT